jgi:hypothetical protein
MPILNKHIFRLISIWNVLVLMAININISAQTRDIINPPHEPDTIAGQDSVCVSETASYSIDLPLSCISNWYVNGIIQSDTGNVLTYLWEESGIFNIEAYIICDTSSSFAGSISVLVSDIPSIPGSISGEDEVCVESSETYYTTVGEDESCLWYVDNIIQISDSTSMLYYWTETGAHTIEVYSENQCGISDPQILEVEAFDTPVVDLGNDTILNAGQTILLNAGNQGAGFLWTTGDTTQTLLVSEPGNYGVTVTNPCGNAFDDINIDFYTYIDEKRTRPYSILNGMIKFIPEVISYEVYDVNGICLLKVIGHETCQLQKNGIFFFHINLNSGRSLISKIMVQ